MKSLFLFTALSILNFSVFAQGDKAKRPSPPATSTTTTPGGVTITIEYGQPSVKGRTIGKDLEPMAGKVWRTGANEATTFEINKDAKIEGKTLAAGKYALFTIANGSDWTIIFNKTAKQWGAYDYKTADDALRVDVKVAKAAAFAEKLTITASKDGKVVLLWGDSEVGFKVD